MTRRASGSAYLLALLVLLVLTGLGIAISRVGGLERRLGRAWAHRQQALYAAESGVEIAVASLLAERPVPLRIELASESVGSATRSILVDLTSPEVISVLPCGACEPGQEIARVVYRVVATGALRMVGDAGGEARDLSRVVTEREVVMQPWSRPSAGGGDGLEGPIDPSCADPALVGRIARELAAELHPPGCRLAASVVQVLGRDPESGTVCSVDVAVCVLFVSWRELEPS